VGILESTQIAQRRFVAERAERLAIEEAARAEQVAEAEAKQATADLDERRARARQGARLDHVRRAKPLEATALRANAAQQAFAATLRDPKATAEQLLVAFTAMRASAAVHSAIRASVDAYEFTATHPGQPLPTRYRDSSPQPTFADVLDQVVAARAAASASAAAVPADLFSGADSEGEKAAQAVEQ
jgi:hypothetical protein